MKKWILLVSILLACFLVLCSCSDAFDFGNINIYETEEVEHNSKADTIDAGTVHKHLFVESDRKAPTCTADGYVKSVCSCGEEVVQAIAALGHNYVEHDGKEPGCEENGWVAYKTCSRCDLSTYREIPALGHDLVEIAAQAPACTEIGWEAYVYCTNCNYTTYAAIPATGHTKDEAVSENEVEPTCTEKGSYDSVVYCADCGEELSREEVEVDALGHNFVDPEEGDYFLMSCCDRCGAYGARRETEGNYDEYFVYDYDEEDYAALKAAYAALLAEIEANTLDDGQNPPEFVKDSEDYAANKAFEQNYYDAYIAEFEKVIAQYQICYLFYNYYDGEDGWEELYITLSDLYDEEFAHYYELYGLVYNTVFRNYFFSAEDGWTEEAIAQTLAQSAAESNPEMIELNKRVSEMRFRTKPPS